MKKYAQSFTASTLSQDIGVAGKGREQQRVKEDRRRGGGAVFFFVSKGAAFPKVPGATLQHLGSPRPFGCLLIANPHLCHMAR